MHEYAITKGIIETVKAEALKSGASKVLSVTLVVGDLSTVLDESIQMYFDIYTEGTIVQGAKLNFKRIAAEFHCNKCDIDFSKPRKGFECPDCGEMGRLTGKGKEFYIESIDIDN